MYLSFLSGLHLCLGRGCGFPQPGVSQKYTQKYTQSIPRSIPEARHNDKSFTRTQSILRGIPEASHDEEGHD